MRKTLIAASLSLFASASANATYIDFDNVANDVVATELTFGSIKVTGGHSDGFNLTASSFNTGQIIRKDVIQDKNNSTPTFGGLGVLSGLTSSSDDNLQGSIGGNTNLDEILFFDFTVATIIDSIVFNGDHTDNPNTGMAIKLFTSTNGSDYTEASSGISSFGAGNDTLTAGFTSRWFAVAAVGPSLANDQGAYIAGINYDGSSILSVPEPGSLALLGLGLAGLGLSRKKQAKA